VSLIPEAVATLAGDGHEIIVERDAGVGAGFNSIYEEAGARIMHGHAEVFSSSDLVVKVKETLPEEYSLLHEGLIVMTYLHLTERMVGDYTVDVFA